MSMTTSTMVDFTRELLGGREVVVDYWQAQERIDALERMLVLYPDLLAVEIDQTQGREICTLRRRAPIE